MEQHRWLVVIFFFTLWGISCIDVCSARVLPEAIPTSSSPWWSVPTLPPISQPTFPKLPIFSLPPISLPKPIIPSPPSSIFPKLPSFPPLSSPRFPTSPLLPLPKLTLPPISLPDKPLLPFPLPPLPQPTLGKFPAWPSSSPPPPPSSPSFPWSTPSWNNPAPPPLAIPFFPWNTPSPPVSTNPWNPWDTPSLPPPSTPWNSLSPPPPAPTWTFPWMSQSPPPLDIDTPSPPPPSTWLFPWDKSPPISTTPSFPWNTPSPPISTGSTFPWNTPSPPISTKPTFPWIPPSPPLSTGPTFPWNTPSPPPSSIWNRPFLSPPSPPQWVGPSLPPFGLPPGGPFFPNGIQFTFSNFTQSWLPEAGVKVTWQSVISIELSLQLFVEALVKPVMLIIEQFDSPPNAPPAWGWKNGISDSKLGAHVGATCTTSNTDGYPTKGLIIIQTPIDNTPDTTITWFTVFFNGWSREKPFSASLDSTRGTFGGFVTNTTLPDLNTFCSHLSSLPRHGARQGLQYVLN